MASSHDEHIKGLWQDLMRPGVQEDLGPVVQSVVSLTSSLRVISLTVLADSIYKYFDIFC